MELMLISFAALVFIVIIGYFGNRALQNSIGYYPIGGPNGGGADKFFSEHPITKAIFDKVDTHGKDDWTNDELKELFLIGAKIILLHYDTVNIVFTEDAAIAFGKPNSQNASAGTKGQIFPATKEDTIMGQISVKNIIGKSSSYITQSAKQKSVVGNAVVGAAVAGGIGAVVGAVSAASHNISNASKTVQTPIWVETDLKRTEFIFYPATEHTAVLQLQKIMVAEGVESIPKEDMKETLKYALNQVWLKS